HVKDAKDHQLDCKVDGAGEMMLTAQFVLRASPSVNPTDAIGG
ncbi:MAG: PhnA domain-containing protein, partial [Pseudomonadota bacterium]|nr:PhnA domain-containing protein [Pseudomonadota bacterium]